MPRQVFHLKIGYMFAKMYPKYNMPEFYLGCISPDAIKAYGKVTEDQKIKSHLKHLDINKWKNNVMGFYKENEAFENKEFLLGFIIHILTDIFYDEKFLGLIEERIANEGVPLVALKKEITEQMRKYEIKQLDKKWWFETREKLKNAKGFRINNIDIKTIEDWKIKVLDDYSKALTSHSLINVLFIKNEMLDEIINDINCFVADFI